MVLASGGVDSTVCLAILSKAIEGLKNIGFPYRPWIYEKNEAKEVQKALDKLGYYQIADN